MTITLSLRQMMQMMKLKSPAPVQARLAHLNRKLAAKGITLEIR